MNKCPDYLTLQAVIDGEEDKEKVEAHLEECAVCRSVYQELQNMIATAGSLASTARLPASFYMELAAKTVPRSFPVALVTVMLFTFALLSTILLNPEFVQWWLAVGITRQLSYLLDAFLDLYFLGYAVGPYGVILALAALVFLEALILNILRKAEVDGNV